MLSCGLEVHAAAVGEVVLAFQQFVDFAWVLRVMHDTKRFLDAFRQIQTLAILKRCRKKSIVKLVAVLVDEWVGHPDVQGRTRARIANRLSALELKVSSFSHVK